MSLFTQKTLKFDYYHVVFIPKYSDREVVASPYDLQSIIDKWDEMTHKERTLLHKQERARLEDWGYFEEVDLYHLQFCKLTEDNLPSLAKENEPTRPMELEDDEFLGKNVSAIYDSDKCVLVLQRNRESLTKTGVEIYLNNFCASNELIRLRPIKLPETEKKVNAAEIIKKINIRFADINKKDISETGAGLKKWLLWFHFIKKGGQI